ncbi:hypothetical protein A8C32_18850 [Flavivirga aquatica]|uniref:Uncharacterized protein n=1 Tax=Flavivirga aquatica TaxID=1849968 RepID=A0A1E5T436_9FLAO|nr:oligosaccharide flippase family protein [Flavivirga aquatica]OEK06091.1 hypothetical protein A8C32_18850 [Flavivirga aquatica]
MSLARNTLFVSLANFCTTLSNLALTIGLAWLLIDKEDFGKVQQLFMIASFTLSILSGFPTGLSYFYGFHKSYSDRVKLFKKFVLSMLIGLGVICIGIFAFKNVIAVSFENNLIIHYFFLFIGIVFLKALTSYFVNYFAIIKKTDKLFIINFSYFIFIMAFLTLLWLKKELVSIELILVYILLLEIVKMIFCFLFIMKYLKVKGELLINKKEFLYILPITGVTLLNTLYVFIDKYMISVMLNPKAYAEYQVGAFIIPFVGIITGSIMVTLLPVFSKLSKEEKFSEIVSILKETTKKTTLLLIPIFCYCLIFGKELIISVYSEKYSFSGEIFKIYTLRFFTTVILFSITMASIGLQNWVVLTAFISLVLNVILNYFFILNYEVMGAVYATIITGYLGIILPIYLINKKLKTKFLNYFPLKEYAFIVLTSILVAYIMYFIAFKILMLSGVWSLFMAGFYYFIILLFSNKLFKVFEMKNLFENLRSKIGI